LSILLDFLLVYEFVVKILYFRKRWISLAFCIHLEFDESLRNELGCTLRSQWRFLMFSYASVELKTLNFG